MVTTEKNKLIIEIETPSPCDELETLQIGILSALQHIDSDAVNLDNNPFYILSELLRNLLPTVQQIKTGIYEVEQKETPEELQRRLELQAEKYK